MKTVPFSKIRNFIIIIGFFVIAGGIGYRLGENQVKIKIGSGKVVNIETPATESIDFSLFWDVWRRVHISFIDAKSIDNQKLVWGAISGMVGALGDPYTTFLPPQENQNFKDDMNGSFEGIGAQLGLKNGQVIVISPLKSSPAESAGLKPDDAIVKVNDESTTGWTVEQAVLKIRGPKGTSVKLSVLHPNSEEPNEISIVRDQIIIPAIESWVKSVDQIAAISGLKDNASLVNNKSVIAYISLSRFGDRLNQEWGDAVNAIIKEKSNRKIRGIVLDLRNNPGGYLDGSVYIASEFMGSGVVVTQQNSDDSKVVYEVNRKGQLLDLPLVVLINKGSASAAEIVAGALKDHQRATIVGEISFGKGSVQTPEELAGGASLHVTTGRWLTPDKISISKKGITPDIEVKLEANTPASQDAQLAQAIEILLK